MTDIHSPDLPFLGGQLGEFGREREGVVTLNYHTAKQLLIQSFRFSQGDPVLQNLLFGAIHTIHPEWRLSEDPEGYSDRLVSSAAKVRDRLTEKGQHSDSRDSSEAVAQEQVESFYRILNNDEVTDMQELIPRICFRMVKRDLLYLQDEGGRPGGEDRKNPYESQFVSYVLRQKPTGNKVFDTLLGQVSDFAKDRAVLTERPVLYTDMSQVIQLYNAQHQTNKMELEI